jgi:hypothetical protein
MTFTFYQHPNHKALLITLKLLIFCITSKKFNKLMKMLTVISALIFTLNFILAIERPRSDNCLCDDFPRIRSDFQFLLNSEKDIQKATLNTSNYFFSFLIKKIDDGLLQIFNQSLQCRNKKDSPRSNTLYVLYKSVVFNGKPFNLTIFSIKTPVIICPTVNKSLKLNPSGYVSISHLKALVEDVCPFKLSPSQKKITTEGIHNIKYQFGDLNCSINLHVDPIGYLFFIYTAIS